MKKHLSDDEVSLDQLINNRESVPKSDSHPDEVRVNSIPFRVYANYFTQGIYRESTNTDKQTFDKETDKQIDSKTDRQMDRQTDKQTDRQTDRQIDRQTDRSIDR